MKKKVIFAFLLLVTIPVFSFNWDKGLLINDDTKFTSVGFKTNTLTQSNGANLWTSFVFGKNSNVSFDLEGTYKYVYSWQIGSSSSFKQVVDLSLCKLSMTFNITKDKAIGFTLGRYFVTDISSVVMSQLCDGIRFEYQGYFMNFSLFTGVTGFLNKFNTTMYGKEYSDCLYQMIYKPTITTYDYMVNHITSIGDINVQKKLSVATSDNFYSFSSGYVPVIATFSIPNFLGKSSFNLQAMGIFDFTGAAYNRYYASASIESPISWFMNYSISTVFETETFNEFANFSSVSLNFIPNSNIILGAGLDFASGELWGFSTFHGFTYIPTDDSSEKPGYSAKLIPKTSFIYVGKKSFGILEEKLIFDIENNSFNMKGLNSKYTETINIFSDIQLSIIISAYVNFADKAENNYSANLKLSFNL
jgi:hypothetical protein